MHCSKKNEFIEDEIAFVTFAFEESSGIFESNFGPMLMEKLFSSLHILLQSCYGNVVFCHKFIYFRSAVRIIL